MHFDGVEMSPSGERQEVESFEWKEFDIERYETDTGWQTDPMDPATVYRMVTMQLAGVRLRHRRRGKAGPARAPGRRVLSSFPTEVIIPAAERFEGSAQVYRSGEQVRVLHGPWQVVIRGIKPHSSRRVLARWEVHRSWVSVASRSAEGSAGRAASWRGGIPIGASERLTSSASELRLRGASEVFYLGASERRLGGASETRFLAASQWVARGASERRLIGRQRMAPRGRQRAAPHGRERTAPRWAPANGTSWVPASGASMGASERRLMGSSERRAPARPSNS